MELTHLFKKNTNYVAEGHTPTAPLCSRIATFSRIAYLPFIWLTFEVFFSITIYSSVLYYTILHHTILHHTILYYTGRLYTVLFFAIVFFLEMGWPPSLPHACHRFVKYREWLSTSTPHEQERMATFSPCHLS